MAWEWVAPTGAAVVGVTAAAVTYVSSQAAQRREDKAAQRQRGYAVLDAQREERKETYLRFLGAVEEVERAIDAIGDTAFVSEPERAKAFAEASGGAVKAVQRLGVRMWEVRLVGSIPVVRAALAVSRDAGRAASEACGGDEPRVVEHDLHADLVSAMAADLLLEPPVT